MCMRACACGRVGVGVHACVHGWLVADQMWVGDGAVCGVVAASGGGVCGGVGVGMAGPVGAARGRRGAVDQLTVALPNVALSRPPSVSVV